MQPNRLAALAIAFTFTFSGCGTPGAPQPPSLNLPDAVTDLSATRAGSEVALTWTMPKKNTDKLLLKADVEVRICRRVGSGACDAAGSLNLAPAAKGMFLETLPQSLADGSTRALTYYVELKNRIGRSAGLSNAAIVLAGEAPAPITDLGAEVRKDGIVLHWMPGNGNELLRLHRKLLTPPATKSPHELLAAAAEPLEETLLVDAKTEPGRAIDKNIRFGQTYEYRAQRIRRVTTNGGTLELAGALSAAVHVEATDVFPPAVPVGLGAVASIENGGASIDLSWQPNTEADLAGYIVYRREADGNWQRISPQPLVVAPAFHDAQVQPGHNYHYAVSAVDQGEHESARSAPADETVPNQ